MNNKKVKYAAHFVNITYLQIIILYINFIHNSQHIKEKWSSDFQLVIYQSTGAKLKNNALTNKL